VELLGILKWFSETKGMGFIADESGGEDVFVHITALRAARLSNLSEGQRVLIRVIETGKGRKAHSSRWRTEALRRRSTGALRRRPPLYKDGQRLATAIGDVMLLQWNETLRPSLMAQRATAP
jgi:cold shock CspA family protein